MRKKHIRKVTLLIALCMLLQSSLCCFAQEANVGVQPLLDNVESIGLSLGFDNNVASCIVVVRDNSYTTRVSGYLILKDTTTGTETARWYVVLDSDPYTVTKTASVVSGHSYNLTFAGYAYGTASSSEYITASVNETN